MFFTPIRLIPKKCHSSLGITTLYCNVRMYSLLKITPNFADYFTRQHTKYLDYQGRLEQLNFRDPTEMNDLMIKSSHLRSVSSLWGRYLEIQQEMQQLEDLLSDSSMKDLALEDLRVFRSEASELEDSLMRDVLEKAIKESASESDDYAILEIRGCK